MTGKTKGRQKIKIKKISNESKLLVTFSKRRAGLFKKSSELTIRCGVELSIIVFSPGEKVFSFGHPSVPTLVNRYLNNSPLPNTIAAATSGISPEEECRRAKVEKLNKELMEMNEQIEYEKKRGEELDKMKKVREVNGKWWEKPVGELSLYELEKLKEAMEVLKFNGVKQAQSIMVSAGNFYAGSSSAGGHFGDSSAAPPSMNPHAF